MNSRGHGAPGERRRAKVAATIIDMTRQDHRPAQHDLWQLTLRTTETFAGMDAAIQRIAAAVYTRDAALSKALPATWFEVHNALGHYDYEQQGIPRGDLGAALQELVRRGTESVGTVRRLLARADQILGREKYLSILVGRPAS